MSHRNRADLEGVETSPDGRYIRFDEKLGAGAYKSVWLAYDTDLGIEVAWNTVELKRLPEREKIRLKSETDILKNLNHNCIINFYNSWENPEAEQVVFTTEIVTSGTLKQYVSRFKPIKLKVIKKWCRQILQGLCYLHSKNPPIIHRDLKCDNIFINGSTGDIRIGDLGLSTMRNATHVASVLGTPEFMAPELYDEWYTEKVDVYAFGMVVLEMISNEYPYAECTNTAQIYKKVSAGIRPESLNRLPNSATRDFIELCLAKSNLRLAAEDLTRHPFLDPRFMDFRERFSIPYEPINGASPSTPLVPVMELAAVAEHSQLSTDQPIFEEERQDSAADASEVSSLEVVLESTVENIARIALRLDLGSRRKEIKFPFDLESDTADAVAVEMVKELGLQQSSQPKLADGIYLAIKEEKAKWRQAKLMPSNVTRTASVVADTLQHLHIAPQQYGASLQPAPLGTIDAIADIFTGVAAHPLEKLLEPSPPTASNLPQPSFHAQSQNPSQANFPLQNQTNVPFVNASSTVPLTGAQIPSPFQAQQSLPFSSPTPISSSFSVHSSSSENGVLPTTGQFQKTVPAAVAHPSLPATQAAFSTPAGSTSGLASTNSIPVQPPPFSSLSTKVAPTFLSDAGSQSSIPVPGQVSSAHSSGMSQASTQSSPPSAAQSHNASSLANQSQPVPGHPNLQGYPQSTTFLQPAPTLVQVQSAPIQFPSASNTPPFPSQPPSSFQIHSQSSPTTATPYPSGQVPAVAATGAPSTPAIFAQTPNFSAPSGSVPSAIQSSQQSNGNAPPVQTFQAEPPNASAESSWSASNIPSAISGSGPAQPLHVSGLSSPPAVAPRVVKRRSIDDGRVSESGIQEGEGSNDSVSSRSGKSSPDAALDMSAFLSGFDTSILNTTQVSTLRSIRSQLDDSIRALKAQYAAMYREAVNKYKSEVVDSLTGWGISVPPLNLKAQGVPSNRNQGGHRTLRSVGQLSRRTRDVINIAQGSFSDLQSLDAPASAPNSTNNPSSVRVPSSQGPDIADHIYNRLIQPFAPADSSSECSQDLQTINSSQASVANMQQASQLQPSSQSQPIGGGYWPTDMDIIDPLVWDHTTQPSS